MKYNIVVDSCCDLTNDIKEELGIRTVPLTMNLGDKSFIDDDTLDLDNFMAEMSACKKKIGSSAPPPGLYKEAFLASPELSGEDSASYAVTLSGNLSASYTSAQLGKTMAMEENITDIHVFDSKSASAGEILIVLKLINLINRGIHKSGIISSIESFIKEMKTYFVLENIDNLVKNGRLHKITGKLVSVLNIKPVLGSDGDGNISFFSHSRGEKQTIEKLSDTIEKSGRDTQGEIMVITHCNNPSLAEKLKSAIKNRYSFKDIFIFPTRGLSSMYANNKGIIMSF